MTQETTEKGIAKAFMMGSTCWRTTEEVIREIKMSSTSYREFQEMRKDWREEFLEFCVGKRTLPLLYDPFFKVVFHPDVHPDRLSDFLSCLMGRQVKVKEILPNEDSLLGEGSLLIMDILVELEDGSLANVEIQKIPYLFPGERMSCYSSDLLLRQYSRVKGEKGKGFKYDDIHKVWTIIIYEKSSDEFHKTEDQYIHHGRTVFNTGLDVELLQEYLLIALDVFKGNAYTKRETRLDGWLSLLSTANLEEAEENCRRYPWLTEIYREMSGYRTKPREALQMYSEALKILDRNTAQYMIEEQQKVIEEKDKVIDEKDKVIDEKDKALYEKEQEIARLKALLEEQK